MDHKFKIFSTTTVPGYKQILAEVNESEPSVKFSYNQKLYKRKLYYPNTYTNVIKISSNSEKMELSFSN